MCLSALANYLEIKFLPQLQSEQIRPKPTDLLHARQGTAGLVVETILPNVLLRPAGDSWVLD